ncbi:urease accessory UreF family protein [Shinella sumterensis]|uniref:Urease accessory protein UreF n=2 Tax=Shinella sumterensis TaxID=1967501 RepID=A0AA50CKL8_9HYPH|nr:urease accessory UreF family protein [Shinella sumterensis]WLR97790.1 urease accessory UreF family protein [Shinella sumterensis]
MTEPAALVRLMTWLSPAFPVGAFSYSGGLEQVVSDGDVRDAATLRDWLSSLLSHGNFWNDAVLFAEAHRNVDAEEQLKAVAALAEALAGSAERHREAMLQGSAFLAAASGWPHPVLGVLGEAAAYPVAVGAVAGGHGILAEAALAAFLHAVASNLVSVAIRCGVIGQRDGVAVLAGLEPQVIAMAERAAGSTLDDLGSATIRAEIASLRHETLTTRLFRS